MKQTLSFLLILVLQSAAWSQKLPNYQPGDLLTQQGIELYDSGEYDAALEKFKQVHPGDSAYAWSIYETSLTYVAKEEYQTAIEYAELGLALDQPFYYPDLYNQLGTAYDELGQREKAIDIYTNAIKSMPYSHSLYYNRAIVYINDSQIVKAFADLKEAVRINPKYASSHLRLAYLALGAKKYAQAFMAAGVFLTLEPTGQRANGLLAQFNRISSDGGTEYENGADVLQKEFGNQSKLNTLIENQIALNEKYEVPTSLDLPINKNFYLIISKLQSDKNNDNFWERFYIPFYKSLKENEVYKGFSYVIMASSESSNHQQKIAQNKSRIEDYFEWVGSYLSEFRSFRVESFNGKVQPVKYYYYNNDKLQARAEYDDASKEPNGYAEFYNINGAFETEAYFNASSERDNKWTYYYSDSSVSSVVEYKSGLRNGSSTDFFRNGLIKLSATYTDDQVDGVTKIYHRDGYLTRQMFHKEGVIQDSLVYYYPDGKPDTRLKMRDGKVEGVAAYYDPLGQKVGSQEYADDQRNGKYEYFHTNGQKSIECSYKDNEYDGEYISYFMNGQVRKKGLYIEGRKAGTWKTYFYNGKVDEIENYDEDGKQTGVYQDFTFDGFKTTELDYEKGDIVACRSFDASGKVIHESERKWNKFYLELYNLDSTKVVEGEYDDDHKEGVWKYYDDNGILTSIETHNKEGLLDGESKTFYPFGEVKSITNYKEGEKHGYFVNKYANGNIESQGWMENGNYEGPYETFTLGEVLVRRTHYNAGKRNGPSFIYDNNGKLVKVEYYNYGTLTKVESYDGAENMVGEAIIEKGNGFDEFLFPTGELAYKLTYLNGNYYGKNEYFYGDGTPYFTANQIRNNLYGDVVYYHPNGAIKTQGTYTVYERAGDWKEFYDNGSLKSEYRYENGSLHGVKREYNKEGKKTAEVNYYQGEINGPRYFYRDGEIDHIRYYLLGRIVGYSYLGKDGNPVDTIPIRKETGKVISYFQNGKKSREYTLENGMFTDYYIEYYKDGTVASKGMYKNDYRDGEVLVYYPDGTLKRKESWSLNYKNGPTVYYHKNGKVEKTVPYVYDDIIGTFKVFDNTGKAIEEHTYWNDFLLNSKTL